MSVTIVPGLIGSLFGAPFKAIAKVGLSATSNWVVAGAQAMLAEVIKVVGWVSTPSLSANWFSGSYWQMAGLAMLLTVPFLFAAAVQAVVRTDLGLLLRAAFVDLPVAVLAVTLTAPLITLLLAATDEMCALVTGGGTVGGSFLAATANDLAVAHSGFMMMVIAVVILLAGMVLMVELIMRAAAIYIVVLFLPLGFAAMVWPARRVWVKRMIELLIALILSKFAMVAVLSLAVTGLASIGSSPSSVTTALTAMALIVLAAFSPWALLRLLPFTEIAAGAGAMLHQETHRGRDRAATTGRHSATLAAGAVLAGYDAVGELVRNGAAFSSGGGQRQGSLLLRGGGGGREGGGGGGRADAAQDAFPSFDEPTPVPHAGGAPSGAASGGSSGAASGGPVPSPSAGASANAPAEPANAPRGASGNTSEASRAALAGPESPASDASAKSPIADLSPFWHPDNAQDEVQLRGGQFGWARSPDRGAGGAGGAGAAGDAGDAGGSPEADSARGGL